MRISLFLAALLSLGSIGTAQNTLPGCETNPELLRTLREKLAQPDLGKMKFVDQAALQHAVLAESISRFPREAEPHRELIDFVRGFEPDNLLALRSQYREAAALHADDPLALYLAAYALSGADTPESIRLLEAARAKAAEFPLADLQLATIYSSGKLVDKKKAAEYLTSFFRACPASTDWRAQSLLSKLGDNAAQTRVAMALRAQLVGETDPERLKQYAVLWRYWVLWGLEFRTRPPKEHAALREQVAKDLTRLESLNPKPDARWLALLGKGYKESGASEATLKAMDDRILREFPSSPEAYEVVSSQWTKDHKEPEDSKDAAAWLAYNRIYEEALKGWIRDDFPDLTYLGRSSWFYTISNDFTISEKDGVAAMDRFLKFSEDYEAPSSSSYIDAADFLIQHRWQPKRALVLLRKAQPLLAKELEADAKDDNLSAEDSDNLENDQTYQRQNLTGLMLQAARLAGRPVEAKALRSSVEAPPPKSQKRQSYYWLNRARLAALENRKADALTYYQRALQARLAPPTPWQGRLRDDITDEARALWTGMGGTEVAWTVWSTSGGAKPEELKEGRWEKPKKTLPAFELADLSNKTWKLQSLKGKSVLINLWATWCGPCNSELPHLQKLYETVKDRTDLQILTFNIDEDLGLVEPFLKEKGYTFTVIPAYSLVEGLLDGVAIPQNWVVDPRGIWRWTQLGFDGAPDFVEAMIQRLVSVQKSE